MRAMKLILCIATFMLVARRPFKVYAWLDRGFYRVGDTVKASFKARTLDQKPVAGKGRLKLLRITFTFDNKLIIAGKEIPTGTQTIMLKKSGKGSIHFDAYVDYFTLENPIRREGLEIKVRRSAYRLKQVDKVIKDSGARGQVVDRRVEKYAREPLENLAALKSGELAEIELLIESKNDYEYLVFEDMNAAGFEPVEVCSGCTDNEMAAYVEFRDQKVCFFVRRLARGQHSISYRLRAEIPGKFSALPARGYAMYAPELKANSDELKLIIKNN